METNTTYLNKQTTETTAAECQGVIEKLIGCVSMFLPRKCTVLIKPIFWLIRRGL